MKFVCDWLSFYWVRDPGNSKMKFEWYCKSFYLIIVGAVAQVEENFIIIFIYYHCLMLCLSRRRFFGRSPAVGFAGYQAWIIHRALSSLISPREAQATASSVHVGKGLGHVRACRHTGNAREKYFVCRNFCSCTFHLLYRFSFFSLAFRFVFSFLYLISFLHLIYFYFIVMAS